MWQVTGQDQIVTLLKRSLETGVLAHAYLLVGPAHVGKTTLAVDLAMALNCEQADPPCQECSSCSKIQAANHPDVQVIGLLKNSESAEAKLISIDQIKELQHTASLPPFEGKHKAFIINGAELMSVDAANCLLKTLEEPVGGVTFILLSVNDKLLPETVVSRCQRLELRPMSTNDVTTVLTTNPGSPEERARLLAGLSRGCLGWALAAAADESLLEHRNESLDMMLAVLDSSYTERFDAVNRMASQFTRNRAAVYDTLELWGDFWRDVLLARLECNDLITSIDRKHEIMEIAGRYRLKQITSSIKSIRTAAEQLARNANPRLVLEVLMLDIAGKEPGMTGKTAARITG
ncbi:MAG: AAA family ATPase [Dehalococcoidia bacterium]|jgi:DNA polymerase-3 subunit delta'